ncbi:hypothetical protein DRO31_06860 [Candidatus Bathyarchaeota archaeon]|nr:MAG: hypothetical protein DRO31_06860 [Candidatus Bathyarchaeota archaeon]
MTSVKKWLIGFGILISITLIYASILVINNQTTIEKIGFGFEKNIDPNYVPQNITQLNYMKKENVTLYFNEYKNNNDFLILHILNSNNYKIHYNLTYKLEIYVNETWIRVEKHLSNNTLINEGEIIQDPLSITEWNIDVSILEQGVYRVIQEIRFKDDNDIQYFIEFQIV